MAFRLSGLDPAQFEHLYGLDDEALSALRAQRMIVDKSPGFPDRIEMRDLEPGESAILLNHVHQPADTPYRASHAIFVREGARTAFATIDQVPEVIRIRPISLRAFNTAGEMIDADLIDGQVIERLIDRFLADPAVAYLHAHYAKRGCYAARIERA